jgi:hypothetical protein
VRWQEFFGSWAKCFGMSAQISNSPYPLHELCRHTLSASCGLSLWCIRSRFSEQSRTQSLERRGEEAICQLPNGQILFRTGMHVLRLSRNFRNLVELAPAQPSYLRVDVTLSWRATRCNSPC